MLQAGFKKVLQIGFWQQLFLAFLMTCQRFPLAILSLVLFTSLSLLENHNLDLLSDSQFEKSMLLSVSGAFWFVAAALFAESHRWEKLKQYSFATPVFVIITWQIFSNDSLAIASWTLMLSLALAVTFAAYVFRRNDNASIWYFNFQLVTGFCFAVLSALILNGGLSLILKSIEYLFEINFSTKFYVDIWLVGCCFFAPAYFLTNVPTRFDYQQSDCQFPRGVHFIQNYVLVPLSIIFMVILYAYFVKILLQWELPRGNLGKMISTFGVIGIFTHLTIFPVHDRGAPLLTWFYRNFYKVMFVPLGLLTLAITVRLSQYGLTEARYVVVMSVIWFGLLIAHYLIKGTDFQIRNVVILLAALCLLASFGSWRIDKLPVQNQFVRLQALLVEQNLLVENKYITPKEQPSFETRKSISSIISYLLSRDAAEKIRPWFTDKTAFDEVVDCDDQRCRYYDSTALVEHMGIDYVERWQKSGEGGSFHVNLINEGDNGPYGNYKRKVSIKGFDYMIQVSPYHSDCRNGCDDLVNDIVPEGEVRTILGDDNTLKVISNDFYALNFDLNKILESLQGRRSIQLPPEEAHKLILEQSSKKVRARLVINHISGIVENGKKRTTSLDGVLLLKFKADE